MAAEIQGINEKTQVVITSMREAAGAGELIESYASRMAIPPQELLHRMTPAIAWLANKDANTLSNFIPYSLLQAVLRSAYLGLDPGKGECYIFQAYQVSKENGKFTCHMEVSPLGWRKLLFEAGASQVNVIALLPGDDVHLDVDELGVLKMRAALMPHSERCEIDENSLTGVFVSIPYKDGTPPTQRVVSRAWIDKRKAVSPSQGKSDQGPWHKWYAEMAKAKAIGFAAAESPLTALIDKISEIKAAEEQLAKEAESNAVFTVVDNPQINTSTPDNPLAKAVAERGSSAGEPLALKVNLPSAQPLPHTPAEQPNQPANGDLAKTLSQNNALLNAIPKFLMPFDDRFKLVEKYGEKAVKLAEVMFNERQIAANTLSEKAVYALNADSVMAKFAEEVANVIQAAVDNPGDKQARKRAVVYENAFSEKWMDYMQRYLEDSLPKMDREDSALVEVATEDVAAYAEDEDTFDPDSLE